MRARKPFSSLRDCASGLPTSCVSVCASVSSSVATARRKRAIAIARLASGVAGHAGCALRARCGLGGDAGGVVGGHFGERRAVGGVGDLQGLHAVPARRAPRRGSRRAAARRRACLRRADGTRGATARRPCSCRRGRRIASIMPSAGQRASTTKPGARSLTAWWWTLLTTARIDALEELGQPRARHELDRVEVAVVDLGVAVLARAGPLRADVLQQRAAEGDVHQLQAAADAEHRLAALGEGREQRRARSRRGCGRRSTSAAAASRRSSSARRRSRPRGRARRASRRSRRA